MTRRELFAFPDPVNETSARLVATGVVTLSSAFLVTSSGWVLLLLAFGFGARVATGPTLSPLGSFVTGVATPWVERRFGVTSRLVPGPPKRFAQGIGLTFAGSAAVGWLLGFPVVAYTLVVMLIGAAFLEAALAICLGCIIYRALWDCEDCADIRDRLQALSARDAVAADTGHGHSAAGSIPSTP